MKIFIPIIAAGLLAGCAGTPLGDATQRFIENPSAATATELGAANTATNIIKTCVATRAFGLEEQVVMKFLMDRGKATGHYDTISCAPRTPVTPPQQ